MHCLGDCVRRGHGPVCERRVFLPGPCKVRGLWYPDQGDPPGFCTVYAIEGRYPPSVEYLEEHYGIQIDRERYNVFYSGFASNIMPDITVIPAKGGEDSEWQP